MTKILVFVHSILWGAPALVMILGVGLFLSVRTDFVQLRLLPRALKQFAGMLCSHRSEPGDRSSFRALCTALAATVGTGNLVGVAGAICLGGPGAVFWMWICGIFAMMTKFAEVILAVRFRVRRGGEILGGPMYLITRGMGDKWRPLAAAYCLFGVIASFGVGNSAQINAVISGFHGLMEGAGIAVTPRRDLALGLLLSVTVGAMLLGGAKRVGAAAERLVPFAAGGYIALCAAVLLYRMGDIPDAFGQILRGAFSPRAVTGGTIGSAFAALRTGCSRGVFTNEAGMGTASIAHAAARVDHPVQQGLLGIVEVFLDTLVICTLTALVILTSGAEIPYGLDAGGELTLAAFDAACGSWSRLFLAGAMCCFALATVLGWGLYGARCAQFLFGGKAWTAFALLQTLAVIPAAVLNTETVWLFAETVNGLMAIPNLIALAYLSREAVRLTIDYTKRSGGAAVGGGNYADFHQCKPL